LFPKWTGNKRRTIFYLVDPFKKMKIKHKILEELYQVQLVNKQENVTLIDVSMNLDVLRTKIKSKEQDFQSSLEVLYANKEINISMPDNLATITRDGIVSL